MPAVRSVDGRTVTVPGAMVDQGRHDKISILLTLIAVIGIGYLLVWTDKIGTSLSDKLLFAGFMICMGNILHFIAMRPRPDLVMTLSETTSIFTFAAAAILALLFYNVFVKSGLVTLYPQATVLDQNGRVLFYFIMAIAEETFFAFGLFCMLTYYDMNPILSSFTVSIFFAIFHVVVYGLSFSVFAMLFFARFVLNFVYFLSGRISTSMIVHAFINIVACM
ncbi:MAG: CPBP family intramembrane metalloprotease [Desulfobacterales bacterium]|nr:CPBP family intramembrane metalloprotease [Desulfobacterales bacterium]